MKAPDKIYVDDLAVVNNCVTKISLKQLPNFSEYISKDALLEWAEEEMMKAAKQSDAYGRRNTFMDVIDKLNSI